MGLDVYLYKAESEEMLAHLVSSSEYEHAHFDIREGEEIRLDSKAHPNHHWKVGYFRSSYNPGGFNWIMRGRHLPTLYDIFYPSPGNDCYIRVNWRDALDGAIEARKAFQQSGNSSLGGPLTEEEALWYIEAFDVAIETCEYVLAQENPRLYYLHWSA